MHGLAQVEAEASSVTLTVCCTCIINAKEIIEAGEKLHEYAVKFHEKCKKDPKVYDEHGHEIVDLAQVQADYEDALLAQASSSFGRDRANAMSE